MSIIGRLFGSDEAAAVKTPDFCPQFRAHYSRDLLRGEPRPWPKRPACAGWC